MPMGLTQDVASGNQILAGLSREKYPALLSNPRPVNLVTNKVLNSLARIRFSRHVMFSSVMSLNNRRSEFSL